MLLTTSEKAKQVRGMMLDIVIAVIIEKTGGGTKYIFCIVIQVVDES